MDFVLFFVFLLLYVRLGYFFFFCVVCMYDFFFVCLFVC